MTAIDAVRTYFEAIERRDAAAAAGHWAPDGVERIAGAGADLRGPEEIRAYFAELFAALPDVELRARELIEQDGRVAVLWDMTGTFSGGPLQGLQANGARIRIGGSDFFRVRDGLLVENDSYPDALGLARQVGLLPAPDSKAQDRLNRAFNAKTRAAQRIVSELEQVAEGVWRLRGGLPAKDFNVFFIEDVGGGVTMFDAGIKSMARAVAAAGASLGGINRVVLGHAHQDHRGTAPSLHVPVFCHEADRADAEGGGEHYFDYSKLAPHARFAYPYLLRFWDGGPVAIAGTVAAGEEISGFRVVHLPGHSPGQIGLHREHDRLALTSDCFYMVDVLTGRHLASPRLPHPAFNWDTEQARASMRKLAQLDLATAWPAHLGPLVGDVRGQLERGAEG